jgi:hypothetical protein
MRKSASLKKVFFKPNPRRNHKAPFSGAHTGDDFEGEVSP